MSFNFNEGGELEWQNNIYALHASQKVIRKL